MKYNVLRSATLVAIAALSISTNVSAAPRVQTDETGSPTTIAVDLSTVKATDPDAATKAEQLVRAAATASCDVIWKEPIFQMANENDCINPLVARTMKGVDQKIAAIKAAHALATN